MSEDRRKMNRPSTGTVPKTKCRNTYLNERDSPQSWTNNLAADFHRLNLSDCLRNSRRNLPPYCGMNTTSVEEQRHVNPTVNGSVTPNTSSSTSRRNSSGTVPKCDNVAKYPDKKQIEDKLSQIREYLQITTSLMSSMKNTDDQCGDASERNNLAQMINDLRDSETKLVNILASFDTPDADGDNGIDEQADRNDNYSDAASAAATSNSLHNDLEEQQLSFLSLQQKAENRMKDARQIQEKLMMAQYDVNSSMNQRDKKCTSVQDFDAAIRELDERAKRHNEPRGSNVNIQDKLLAEVDNLQSQIAHLQNVTDDRQQLIQVLDNRDSELRSQHLELQSKLAELQTKKMQVDHLVTQLQNMDDAGDEDDVGMQVRRIVTMKDHLSKLKDMLEIVKTTENVVQNSTPEEQEIICDMCNKTENFLQKDGEKRKTTPVQMQQHESNVLLRYDNTGTVNENRHKQINKNAMSYDRQGFGGAKPKSRSNSEKMALRVELEAKKRELEEIMGKHKAGTSNLNHDVGTDNKSEFSCSSNAYYEAAPSWAPVMSDHNRFDSSESDECHEDINEYLLNYPQSKQEKSRSDPSADYVHIQDTRRLASVPRTPERSPRERPCSNSEQGAKNQVQKQLELIRSVCDSMLEQQQNVSVRNNLTPSTIYSEPRRFASPNPHAMNALVETPWVSDPGNYQGWLANNTLQTQAFMLNTLNQCCQMLWIQQRELNTLRQAVNQLQERDGSHFDAQSHLASPLQNPESRARSNQKINQVAAACSMPNLNQYNIPSVNLDPSFQNNMQNARLLDQCLNNANLSNGDHINNSVLHAVNANINHQIPGQLWNGQALNNQVAPGNRANNYWDNFRSYSRQNLLSTKSNEGFQNIATNNPFTVVSMSKSNSDHTSSQENTPVRRAQFERNRNNSGVPPDVLNVNHNVNKTADVRPNQRNLIEAEYAFAYNEISSTASNISEEQIFKECISETASRRNEWHEDQTEEPHPKSKLFEELRDNVYKEVVTLISANETRPHFLIQLFRDLQMISSDPLRLKILQSIQTIITHSLISSNHHVNRQQLEPEQNESAIADGGFSLQSTVWSKSLKNPAAISRNALHLENEAAETESVIKEIIPYLNDHEDDVLTHPVLMSLKQVLLESESFRDAVRDSVFKKHFSNVLDEVLAQYHGKKVRDVKMHLIQTINNLLRGELSFIQLIRETCPENCDGGDVSAFETSPGAVNGQVDGVQNGDLAEADQGRVEDEEIDEEGAVGGFWDLQLEPPAVSVEEVFGPVLEFPNNAETQTQFIKQGLDQVPTRLPTKSRSTTPSKDRSTSSRSDHPDQF